jgi:hypothetical protein
MEISKPKEFKLKPKPKLPGVTVWGDQTANRQPMIRPQFNVQMLQEFNVVIDGERWNVRASGVNVRMENFRYDNGVMGARQAVRFEPLTVEFYSGDYLSFTTSSLRRWIDACSFDDRIIEMPHGYKRDLRFETIDNPNEGFIIYGAVISSFNVNPGLGERWNIDPLVECDIVFERYERI